MVIFTNLLRGTKKTHLCNLILEMIQLTTLARYEKGPVVFVIRSSILPFHLPVGTHLSLSGNLVSVSPDFYTSQFFLLFL